jgi:hypothetical protein
MGRIKGSKNNQLDGRQKFRLQVWLDTQRDRIGRQKLSSPVIAEEAAKALEFPVTEHNIRGACEVIGLILPVSQTRLNNKQMEEELAKLPQTVREILARLDWLEASLKAILPPKGD